MHRILGRIVAVSLLGTGVIACSDASLPPNGCIVGPVSTMSGEVCGLEVDSAGTTVSAFLGIPYAESTAGANRWQPPVPARPAGRILQATAFGDICWQEALPSSANAASLPAQSEDCLSVNLWVPKGSTSRSDLPVLVFIHGGAFIFGSSAIPTYDGAYMAATQDVILVTLNYRLGAFGFLAGIAGLEGNYGFLDQQLALEWVGDNIRQFGGNPDNVTIFGESAGAMSVGLHLLSAPESKPLFVAGMMESNPFAVPYQTLEQAGVKGARLAKLLGCEGATELACLRAAPAPDIAAAQSNPAVILPDPRNLFQTLLPWVPVVDGDVIDEQPIVAAEQSGVEKPVLIGTNRNEGTSFVALATTVGILPSPLTDEDYAVAIRLFFGAANIPAIVARYPPTANNAAQLSQIVTDYIFTCASRFVAGTAQSSAYAYEFNQVSNFNLSGVPACKDEVCHAAELPYVFHSAEQLGFLFTPSEDALSRDMVAYWASFGFPGHDPNRASPKVDWPAFLPAKNYILLDTPITTQVNPPHHCEYWDTIGYDLTGLAGL